MSGASLLASRHFLLKTRAFDECPCRDCHEAARPYRERNRGGAYFVFTPVIYQVALKRLHEHAPNSFPTQGK